MRPTLATAKDVWVVGGTVAPPEIRRREPLPQVDLIASVPTRAAEALFWAGRAMERAELIARAMEVVLDRTSGLVDSEVAEPWVVHGLDMLSARGRGDGPHRPAGDRSGRSDVRARGRGAGGSARVVPRRGVVGARVLLGDGRTHARSARRVPGAASMARSDTDGSSSSVVDIARIDGRHLESILVDLASLVGLWNESVVHGPAWRFGEVGRRLERAFGVIDGVRGAFGLYEGRGRRSMSSPLVGPARRRRRVRRPSSRLPTPATRRDRARLQREPRCLSSASPQRRRARRPHCTSLVAEVHNPRAAASAIRGVRHQADRLGWQFGVETAIGAARRARASRRSIRSSATVATLAEVFAGCDLLARDVVGSYLAAPVDPRMMGRG